MHTEIIKKLIEKLSFKSYLEIGLGQGINWSQIDCEKKVGVEPNLLIPNLKYGDCLTWNNETIYKKTSSDFFYYFGNPAKFDLIFIDGLHTHEQSLNDVRYSEFLLSDKGIILMHDTNPSNETESMIYETFMNRNPHYVGPWVGDVWKTIFHLQMQDYFDIFTLDMPFGLTFLTVNKDKKAKKEKKEIIADIKGLPYSFFDEKRDKILNLKNITYLGEFLQKYAPIID